MGLELKITTALKEAMKSKNQTALTALRAVKSAILLHKTQKSSDGDLSQEDEMKYCDYVFVLVHLRTSPLSDLYMKEPFLFASTYFTTRTRE